MYARISVGASVGASVGRLLDFVGRLLDFVGRLLDFVGRLLDLYTKNSRFCKVDFTKLTKKYEKMKKNVK